MQIRAKNFSTFCLTHQRENIEISLQYSLQGFHRDKALRNKGQFEKGIPRPNSGKVKTNNFTLEGEYIF